VPSVPVAVVTTSQSAGFRTTTFGAKPACCIVLMPSLIASGIDS